MPIFFQHQINEGTRLGIWKIEEDESFFKANVPQHRDVTHPHKRLQHLAGRFLLQFLFPDFPYELIQVADTKKPYLSGELYHFSISHCGDFAAAIISKNNRVGIDIEIPVPKLQRISGKFLSVNEVERFGFNNDEVFLSKLTVCWSAKESVFKWYGEGAVDFRQHISLEHWNVTDNEIDCLFKKSNTRLTVHYHQFEHLVLAWVTS